MTSYFHPLIFSLCCYGKNEQLDEQGKSAVTNLFVVDLFTTQHVKAYRAISALWT